MKGHLVGVLDLEGLIDRTLKDELPQMGAQYATANQRRNNPRKNEEMEPKQKQHLVVHLTVYGSKF